MKISQNNKYGKNVIRNITESKEIESKDSWWKSIVKFFVWIFGLVFNG